jgi:hypothetical protein
MDLHTIDLGNDPRLQQGLHITGPRANPAYVNQAFVQPVFDLSGGGNGYNTDASPTRVNGSNHKYSPVYGYALDGLSGLYCPGILSVGMESGYDTSNVSPDWGYIGWIPRDKIFVPICIDWHLVFTSGGEVSVTNKSVSVDLILYLLSEEYNHSDGVRLPLQHQQFVLQSGNSHYQNGTYGMPMSTVLNLPQSHWSGGFDFTYAAGVGSITEKSADPINFSPSGGSDSYTSRTVCITPFRVPIVPARCGLGFYVHFDNLYADEALFPVGTTFFRRVFGFLFDANAPVPQLMI